MSGDEGEDRPRPNDVKEAFDRMERRLGPSCGSFCGNRPGFCSRGDPHPALVSLENDYCGPILRFFLLPGSPKSSVFNEA